MREQLRSGRRTDDLLTTIAVVIGAGAAFYAAARLADSETAGSSRGSLSQLVGVVEQQLSSHSQETQAAPAPAPPVEAAPPPPAPTRAPTYTPLLVEVAASGEVAPSGRVPYHREPGVYKIHADVDPHVIAARLKGGRRTGHITTQVHMQLIREGIGPQRRYTITVRTYDGAGHLADRAFTLRINSP